MAWRHRGGRWIIVNRMFGTWHFTMCMFNKRQKSELSGVRWRTLERALLRGDTKSAIRRVLTVTWERLASWRSASLNPSYQSSSILQKGRPTPDHGTTMTLWWCRLGPVGLALARCGSQTCACTVIILFVLVQELTQSLLLIVPLLSPMHRWK